MKKSYLALLFLLMVTVGNSQTVIFSEDFSGGFPVGWTNTDNLALGYVWTVNDTVLYTGEYTTNQSPIASTSGGNHMLLFADAYNNPGGTTEMDAYFETTSIDLSAYSNVHVQFQQEFRWGVGALDYVLSVSGDGGSSWTDYDISDGVTVNSPSGLLNMDIDISSFGGMPTVLLRFHVRAGASHYFFMIDDIKVVEPDPCASFSGTSGSFADDGNCQGYAWMTPSGGTTPYTYYWYSSANTDDYEYNLCAGTYYGKITDLNGCIVDSLETVVNYDPCVNAGIQMGPIYGATSSSNCDGSSEVWVYGPGPYDILWSNGGTGSIDSSLCHGNNWVTATDANGCVDTTYFVVDSIYDPCVGYSVGHYYTINASDDVTCNGSSKGGANYGTAPYSYLWSSGETTEIATALCFGTAWVQITDANACVDTMFTNIDTIYNACDFLYLNYNYTNESGVGNCDGYITIEAESGIAPYSYLWNNSSTSDSLGSLCAGTYSVVTTDANGCVDSTEITVGTDCSLDLSASIVNDISCFGLVDGNIEIVNSNGTAPFLYSIDGVQIRTDPYFDTLAAGTYTIMSQDVNECYGEYQVTIVEPPLLVLDTAYTLSNASCNGLNDGQVIAAASGGTTPYNFQWSNGQVGDTLQNVSAGTHTLYLSDASGCQENASVTVTEPAAMTVTVTETSPTCGASDGSAEVTSVTGGTTPYTYSWTSGDATALSQDLDAGVYQVTVEDANGCEVNSTVNLASATAPAVTVNTTSPSCYGGNDGAIDLVITGGTAPITFDWSTGAQTEDLSSLMAGTYDVTIEDASGCVISEVVSLAGVSQIDLSNVSSTLASCGLSDGELMVTPTGGAGGYTYSWSSGGSADTESGLAAGTYTLTVTDGNGCINSKTYALSNDAAPTISIDEVIQPACEGGNGMISVSVTGGTAPYAYAWSDGSSNQNLVSAVVGNYTLTVTDAGSCEAVAYSELNGINLNAAEICLVTVDTATNGNIVVWTKDYNLGIAEYEIYRETAIFNQFQYLNTVPFDSLSQYVDLAANPDVHAYKYKVRTIDSCGNASDFLALHRTIHLNAELNTSNEVELSWNQYVGINYNKYYIHRYHPTIGWELLDSVASTVHNYVDDNYPSVTDLTYSIEVKPLSPCTAQKAQDHNSTRSNSVNIAPGNLDASVGYMNNEFSIYPNPGSDFIQLNTKIIGTYTLELYDMQGRIVFTTEDNGNTVISAKDFESGVYFVRMTKGGESMGVVKWIKH